MALKIKFSFSFLQKHLRLLSFCIVMLIILGASLMIFNFLKIYVLTPRELAESEIKAGEARVNLRLYREVIKKMNEDKERPQSGIGDLRNPFSQ